MNILTTVTKFYFLLSNLSKILHVAFLLFISIVVNTQVNGLAVKQSNTIVKKIISLISMVKQYTVFSTVSVHEPLSTTCVLCWLLILYERLISSQPINAILSIYCLSVYPQVQFKETRFVTMNIFEKKSFLFKSFVKIELSYVFAINMFSAAENCTEK